MNQKTTTQKHLRSLSKTKQFEKIKTLVTHNLDTLWRQLEWLAIQPKELRLFRITSEFLPLRTVKEFSWLYGQHEIHTLIIERLRGVRRYADDNGIRLVMHPGQFTNLCSDKKEVVAAAIEDFEYHTDLARAMGYGDTWHSSGFAINIHANVRQDPGLKNIRRIIANDLSVEARNLITIENDEYSCFASDLLVNKVFEDVALVFDTHHHWISRAFYATGIAKMMQPFYESWRGIRPLGHFSMPQHEIMPPSFAAVYAKTSPPDYAVLTAIKGISSRDLRAHSYSMWSVPLLDLLMTFLPYMDVEIEAKGKNIAQREVYDYARGLGIL